MQVVAQRAKLRATDVARGLEQLHSLKATRQGDAARLRPNRAWPGQQQTSLGMCVSNGYTATVKDSGLRIRVQRELRDRFNDACRADDKSAAQVLREFMRVYVERYEAAADDPGQGASVLGPKREH